MGVRSPNARQERIRVLDSLIYMATEKNGSASENLLVNNQSLDWGVSPKKVTEYINQLVSAGRVLRDYPDLIHTEALKAKEEARNIAN